MTKDHAMEIVKEYTRGYNQKQMEHIAFIMAYDDLALFTVIDLESNELNRLAFED